MKKKNRTEIEKQKMKNTINKLLVKRQGNLDTITDHTADISELIDAKKIAKKIDKGEHISEQEMSKLQDIKQWYKDFLDNKDTSTMDGLEGAISSKIEDKKSHIDKDIALKEKIQDLTRILKSANSVDKNNIASEKNKLGSLVEDFADVSTEMSDFMDYD